MDDDLLIGEVIRCFELGMNQREGGLEEQDDAWNFWMRYLKTIHAKKQAKDLEEAEARNQAAAAGRPYHPTQKPVIHPLADQIDSLPTWGDDLKLPVED